MALPLGSRVLMEDKFEDERRRHYTWATAVSLFISWTLHIGCGSSIVDEFEDERGNHFTWGRGRFVVD